MAEKSDKTWKKFLSNHWKMVAFIIVACIIAAVGAVYVFLWLVEEAQVTGLVPTTLGSWSMGFIITFLLHLLFWEILFIGIPMIIVAILVWQLWWNKIPEKEKKEYKKAHLPFGERSKKTDSSGGISFLFFVFFAIKVWLDGNWGKPFGTWDLDYLVYTYLWGIIVVLIIFGIPILLGGTWWLRHQMKK
jgi:hypothetical protein